METQELSEQVKVERSPDQQGAQSQPVQQHAIALNQVHVAEGLTIKEIPTVTSASNTSIANQDAIQTQTSALPTAVIATRQRMITTQGHIR